MQATVSTGRAGQQAEELVCMCVCVGGGGGGSIDHCLKHLGKGGGSGVKGGEEVAMQLNAFSPWWC